MRTPAERLVKRVAGRRMSPGDLGTAKHVQLTKAIAAEFRFDFDRVWKLSCEYQRELFQ